MKYGKIKKKEVTMDWELFNTVLNYISGPLIGAVIGYITNYIAVKMLFHPYKPIKIFGLTLPFTPGIIPKRKPHLARAIGNAVGNQLFTEQDITSILCSDETTDEVADIIFGKADDILNRSPEQIIGDLSDEQTVSTIRESTSSFITDKVISSAKEMDLGQIIADKGGEMIKEKKASMGLVGMFLSDELIDSILVQLKDKVNEYIELDGRTLIAEKANEKVGDVFINPLSDVINVSDDEKERIKGKAKMLYKEVVSKAIASISERIDIASVVESKVNAMSVKELEVLCLSVMKRELNAVINLGALIGFVIGIVNIFI